MRVLKPDDIGSVDAVDPEAGSRQSTAQQTPFDWVRRNKLTALVSFVIIIFLMIMFVYWIAVAKNHRWYTSDNPRDTYVGSQDVLQVMAKLWVDARTSCAQIEKEDIPFLPNMEETYKVQDRMIEDHQEELGPLVGWKVGTTNRDMWPTFNLDEPTRAPLFNKYVRFGDVSGSWEREGCGPFHIYEGEFAFVMGSTLEPREGEYTEGEVLAAIGSVAPAIELVSSRADTWCLGDLMAWYTGDFPDPLAAMASCQADAGISGLVVVGPEVGAGEGWAAGLANLSLQLSAQSSAQPPTIITNSAARVLDGPLSSLTWLANHLRRHRRPLLKGHLVISGGVAVHVGDDEIGRRFDVTVQASLRGPSAPPTAVRLSLGEGPMISPGVQSPDLYGGAERLAAARKACAPLPSDQVQLLSNMEEAYTVLDHMAVNFTDVLGPLGGWKVGAFDSGDGPIAAPLFAQDVAQGPLNKSFTQLCGYWGVEGEIAVTMGADLPPKEGEYTAEEVWAAVSHVQAAIEILGTRMPSHCPAYVPGEGDAEGWSPFGDGAAHALATCLADGGMNAFVLLAPPVEKEELPQPALVEGLSGLKEARLELEMHCGTQPRAAVLKTSPPIATDPLLTVRWLANRLSARGLPLKQGHLIMTGMQEMVLQGDPAIDPAAIQGQCRVRASVMFHPAGTNSTWNSADLVITDFPAA